MEVREVGRCGEIICTSVLRAVNGSRCKEVLSLAYRHRHTRQTPREDPNGADGNKCEAVAGKLSGITGVTFGPANMDTLRPSGNNGTQHLENLEEPLCLLQQM